MRGADEVAGKARPRQADGVPSVDATQSVALLGPTNTGKTHRAVERMLEHESGMIGLPLRLLAREIYDRVSARVGEDRVALVTGEEKRVPRRPDYWVCTTEAMPLSRDVDFVAVDEVQLAAHEERGHVFTDRLLRARGRRETWFMGSKAMQKLMADLVPAARHQELPRLSRLSFAGQSKLQKLPPRSAVVAFSVAELYELAARLRSLRGGAAVVLGALSPRARNAQVAMFQAGEVDYLVATDAIGMGLNLDVGHVAFASLRKFDGQRPRALDEGELSQIAGRAGRYLRDGTFGTVAPIELAPAVAERIEQHSFMTVRRVRYRNADLEFSSPEALLASLEAPPPHAYLAPVGQALDLASLRALLRDHEVASLARGGAALELLWQVCEIPDFRHILFEVHVALLRELFLALARGPLTDDYLAHQTGELDDRAGDVDALLARSARLRTWAYVVNRPEWLKNADEWRERLAKLEDGLSDALHSGLVETFVERRARARPIARRALARPLEDTPDRALAVDQHHPFAALARMKGRLHTLPQPEPPAPSRWEAWVDAPHEAFELTDAGTITADGTLLARLVRGASLTQPEVRLEPEDLPAGLRAQLQRRLLAFARDLVARFLAPLEPLRRSSRAPLRAIAYELERGLGSVRRSELGPTLAALSAEDRAQLNETTVEPGMLAVFLPELLAEPALRRRLTLLRAFEPGIRLPPVGRPMLERQALPERLWMTLGYVVLGPRAIRLDLAERMALAFARGLPAADALRPLSLGKTDRDAVAASFRAALP